MKNARLKNVIFSIMLSFFVIFSTTTVSVIPVQAEETVMRTRTGTKYHTHKCGNGTYYYVSLSSALNAGLEPCAKCYPNGHSSNSSSGSTDSHQEYTTPAPKKISLNITSMELLKGKTKKIIVKNASGNIKWSTSDKSVASVSNGLVKAKGAGKATITVTANEQSKNCKVKVEAPKISKTSLSLKSGDTKRIKIIGCKHDINWSTSNNSIAKVDDDGIIYGKNPGKATITGKVHKKRYKCKIVVKRKEVERIELNETSMELCVGENMYLIATTYPDNDVEPVWKSSNDAVVSVDDKGYVCAKSPGTAKITASIDGKTATCAVIVKESSKIPDDFEISSDQTVPSAPITPTSPTTEIFNNKTKLKDFIIQNSNSFDTTYRYIYAINGNEKVCLSYSSYDGLMLSLIKNFNFEGGGGEVSNTFICLDIYDNTTSNIKYAYSYINHYKNLSYNAITNIEIDTYNLTDKLTFYYSGILKENEIEMYSKACNNIQDAFKKINVTLNNTLNMSFKDLGFSSLTDDLLLN